MELNQERLEEGSTDNYRSEPNTSPADELSAVSALARSAGELMIIQTLHRFIGPVLVPILKPLIRELVTEQIGLAKQELLSNMKENPTNQASTSSPKRLKLQFRNKISLPVFTGKCLLGENHTAIEIALVDALTGKIVNSGTESTAKLQIVGFRVGDNGSDDDDSWTFQDFQEKILTENNGKRTLQGNTSLQLKEGVCSVTKISFTHNSENTKNGWYRLGAGVVDAALMSRVEVARTEAFLMKDGRTTYSEKLPHPRLSDKVCHLQHIGYKGNRFRCLKDAGVITVKDFLTLLYKDPKRLQDILKLKASSNVWDVIVKNAQASKGVFLWLDPSNERKTGMVLDVKLQLQGLIVEPHKYIQKVDNKRLVKFASEDLELLEPFEDETSLKEYLMSCTSFSSLSSANQSSGTSIDESARPTSTSITDQTANQGTTQVSIVTSQYEPNQMSYSMNYHLESPNGLNFGAATEKHAHDSTEAGTCSQAVESTLITCGHINDSNLFCEDCLINNLDPIEEFGYFPYEFSDADVMMVAAQTVSVCSIDRARTRWIKVSKLLRRNSVRERVSLTEGIQAFKKQRCC